VFFETLKFTFETLDCTCNCLSLSGFFNVSGGPQTYEFNLGEVIEQQSVGMRWHFPVMKKVCGRFDEICEGGDQNVKDVNLRQDRTGQEFFRSTSLCLLSVSARRNLSKMRVIA